MTLQVQHKKIKDIYYCNYKKKNFILKAANVIHFKLMSSCSGGCRDVLKYYSCRCQKNFSAENAFAFFIQLYDFRHAS